MIFNKFLINYLGETKGAPFGGADPEKASVGLRCFDPILAKLLIRKAISLWGFGLKINK